MCVNAVSVCNMQERAGSMSGQCSPAELSIAVQLLRFCGVGSRACGVPIQVRRAQHLEGQLLISQPDILVSTEEVASVGVLAYWTHPALIGEPLILNPTQIVWHAVPTSAMFPSVSSSKSSWKVSALSSLISLPTSLVTASSALAHSNTRSLTRPVFSARSDRDWCSQAVGRVSKAQRRTRQRQPMLCPTQSSTPSQPTNQRRSH